MLSFRILLWYYVLNRVQLISTEFKARPLPQGIITTRTRKALMKPGPERNQSDIGLIWNLVDRTNAFAAYSHIVRKELAKVVQYCANESGTVVIREGSDLHKSFDKAPLDGTIIHFSDEVS